jgi:hypothetical protein
VAGVGGRRPDRRGHVGLDLACGQRPVVDPDLVDSAREVFAPYGVATDPERERRSNDGAAASLAADLHAIDVEPQGGAVVRCREVRPGVRWKAGGAGRRHVRAAPVHIRGRVGCVVIRVEGIS